MKRICIVGGGASGIAAALSCAAAYPDVAIDLLEALPRVGKKILVTGNGRCNLANTDISPAYYRSQSEDRLAQLIAQMPLQRTLDFFARLGLFCDEEDGRIYPYSHQASSVLDVLLLALNRSKNIHVHTDCRVTSISKSANRFTLVVNGEKRHADAIILSAGGMAAPKHGSDGSGFALAKELGHTCTPLSPCLTAIKCDNPLLKSLKGIRAQGRVTLWQRTTPVYTEEGEIQFTDYGLSGIPIFQLSTSLDTNIMSSISVDLMPSWPQTDMMEFIRQQCRINDEASLEQFMPGLINKRLLCAVLKACGITPLSRKAGSLTRAEQLRIAQTIKNWRFPVVSALDWEQAQVTGGGIPLNEINDRFASQRCDGLYITGELLDATGMCGGYNLHWAWCSGIIAGQAAAK